MAQPTLTTTAQELYDACAPICQTDTPGRSDADNGYAGAILCAGLATMVDPVSDIVRDQADGTPGYAILFQPSQLVNIGRPEWLPWLAQFVGDSQAVQAASTVAAQQAILANPLNFYRGRPQTIINAAKNTLTGNQTVILNRFLGSNPFALGITMYTSQCPNQQATINAINNVLPAWIVATISFVTGGTYATLDASHSTYSAMQAAHTTYADIYSNPGA